MKNYNQKRDEYFDLLEKLIRKTLKINFKSTLFHITWIIKESDYDWIKYIYKNEIRYCKVRNDITAQEASINAEKRGALTNINLTETHPYVIKQSERIYKNIINYEKHDYYELIENIPINSDWYEYYPGEDKLNWRGMYLYKRNKFGQFIYIKISYMLDKYIPISIETLEKLNEQHTINSKKETKLNHLKMILEEIIYVDLKKGNYLKLIE